MEYRIETIPVAEAAAILTRFAADGWRLHTIHPVPVRTRSSLDPAGPASEVGLLVVLERFQRWDLDESANGQGAILAKP